MRVNGHYSFSGHFGERAHCGRDSGEENGVPCLRRDPKESEVLQKGGAFQRSKVADGEGKKLYGEERVVGPD